MMVLGALKEIGNPKNPSDESKKSTRTDCGNVDVFAIVILLAQPPPAAICGNRIELVPANGDKLVLDVVGTMMLPLNCPAGGSAVKKDPLNARPNMATGTFELM